MTGRQVCEYGLIFLAIVLAVFLALWIGDQNYFLMGLTLTPLSFFLLKHFAFKRISIAAFLCSFLFFGYAVGNRGFAQISVSGGLPFFLSEVVLFLLIFRLIFQWLAWQQAPWGTHALDYFVLAYLIYGAVHLTWDVQRFGLVQAIRDSAMTYYAFYYFIGKRLFTQTLDLPHFEKWMKWAFFLIIPAYIFSHYLPAAAMKFSLRHIPIIFHKPDLTGAFAAVGVFFFFLRWKKRSAWRLIWILLMLILTFGVLERAPVAGLFTVLFFFILAGRWKEPLQIFALVMILFLVTLGVEVIAEVDHAQSVLTIVKERFLATIDPLGKLGYATSGGSSAADNTNFRIVWWKILWNDTMRSPLVGLGYGYDLTSEFASTYFGNANFDLSSRSPHNHLLTVFSRLGLIGLFLYLGVVVCLIRSLWEKVRHRERNDSHDHRLFYLCGAMVFLVCGCLQVVLEGPMGAIPFWLFLGLVHRELLPAPTLPQPGRHPTGTRLTPYASRF